MSAMYLLYNVNNHSYLLDTEGFLGCNGSSFTIWKSTLETYEDVSYYNLRQANHLYFFLDNARLYENQRPFLSLN